MSFTTGNQGDDFPEESKIVAFEPCTELPPVGTEVVVIADARAGNGADVDLGDVRTVDDRLGLEVRLGESMTWVRPTYIGRVLR